MVPNEGAAATHELARELQDFVREHLAAHQYPREVTFLDAMPVTVSGKVRRSALRDMLTVSRSGTDSW